MSEAYKESFEKKKIQGRFAKMREITGTICLFKPNLIKYLF